MSEPRGSSIALSGHPPVASAMAIRQWLVIHQWPPPWPSANGWSSTSGLRHGHPPMVGHPPVASAMAIRQWLVIHQWPPPWPSANGWSSTSGLRHGHPPMVGHPPVASAMAIRQWLVIHQWPPPWPSANGWSSTSGLRHGHPPMVGHPPRRVMSLLRPLTNRNANSNKPTELYRHIAVTETRRPRSFSANAHTT